MENKLLTPDIIEDVKECLIQKHDRLLDLAALDAIPTEILPILKPHIQKAIAQQHITSPRILIKLVNSKHIEVRKALLKNPCPPPQVFLTLSNDSNKEIRRLVQRHPQTPVDILTAIYHKSVEEMNLKQENWQIDSKQKSWQQKLVAIAINPQTSAIILEKLEQLTISDESQDNKKNNILSALAQNIN